MTDVTGNISYAYHPVDGSEAKPRRGAHALPRVVFGAPAADWLVRPFHAVSDEGVGNNTRGRVCSPKTFAATSAAKTWAVSYDKADQLEAATQTQSGAVTAQQAFRFDRIGNITSKQDGSEISKGTFNNRNQLTAQEPGGWMRVRGTTNEGASVKVKSNKQGQGKRRFIPALSLTPIRPRLNYSKANLPKHREFEKAACHFTR